MLRYQDVFLKEASEIVIANAKRHIILKDRESEKRKRMNLEIRSLPQYSSSRWTTMTWQ